ncbi:hypothetical protein K432DRAFT_408707 [Lepidopterella palustris CBS 459.81]|uniref:Uncharacterized protein n=1 Tax=Lepidopterella palustris CBS 459.81 TaxID=1314670 RepID=A0A8E2E1Z4_9PEZI|nr:hypothetical protein K432DRAFT_408707 [Lepidopterella palustris CBS 459.81]
MEGLYLLEKQHYVDLLLYARSFQATDQRDIIYSSLGSPLAYYENSEVKVAPDYNESLSSLLVRAACALLRSPRESPYVLLFGTHDSQEELEDDNIPTWVPRWITFDDSSARPIPLTWGRISGSLHAARRSDQA